MVFLMANLCCSGCSPGKSPFGALTRFPLQSGQGVEATGPLGPCTNNDGNTPAKFQPNWFNAHGCRPSPCTWTG